MKSICARTLIFAIEIMSFFCMNASQEIKVCITVDGSQKLRRGNIPVHELEKWGRFYGQQAEPFQYYRPVLSAQYEDCLIDGISFHKNFIKELPAIIRNDQTLSKNERKKYRFPRYISKSFITQLQDAQEVGRTFQRKIYEHKDTKKVVTVTYTINYLQQEKQTGAENLVACDSPIQVRDHEKHSYDYVVELMAFVSLFIG